MTALPVLSKIIFPTGASISYTYEAGKGGCGGQLGYPVITSRIVDANDGHGPQTWTYQIGTGSSTVIDPLGNKTVHTFVQGASFPYETQTQQFDNKGNLLKTVNTNYSYVSWPDPNETPASNTPPYDVLPTNSTTIWPNGQARVSYTYDRDAGVGFNFGVALSSTGGNPQIALGTQPAGYSSRPWTVTETDYGQGAPGPVQRTMNTTFQWRVNSSFSAANILTTPATVTILNGAGSQAAQATYSYDESQYVATPGTYGLATTVSRWLNTGGTISTHTKYNGSGMPVQVIDAKGNSTNYSYDGTDAFLSGVQYPAASGVAHNLSYTHDETLER